MSLSVRDQQGTPLSATCRENNSTRSVLTRRSLDVSVENTEYERLDDQTFTSIPAQPSPKVYKGIHEDANFENREDSDGEVGPFFDAVESEGSMDELYDGKSMSTKETQSVKYMDDIMNMGIILAQYSEPKVAPQGEFVTRQLIVTATLVSL